MYSDIWIELWVANEAVGGHAFDDATSVQERAREWILETLGDTR